MQQKRARNAVIPFILLVLSLSFNGCRENKTSPPNITDNQNVSAPSSTTGNQTNSAPTGTAGTGGQGSQAIPEISLQKIAGGFSNPVHIANAADGSNRLFIVEQQGTIRIVRNGTVLQAPFLDIEERVTSGGEQGLLSVVFPQGYAGKNYFYVNYTSAAGDGDTVIARFRTTSNDDAADPGSEQQILTLDQPFANHNGGLLAFGPDGYLYIGMGDGGGAGDPRENAQNPSVLLGKMLRIDVESGQANGYAVPASNPFADRQGFRPEIWSLGLRNPWRFSFDRATGNLYIADVGQGGYEEVDVQPASSIGGENYGWDIMEGMHCYNAASCDRTGLTLPVHEYETHSRGNCSITGGFVYRGPEFPALQGVYVYGDYCSGRIWGLRQAGNAWENKVILESGLRISTFGEDEAGNLYVADHASGDIFKIVVQ